MNDKKIGFFAYEEISTDGFKRSMIIPKIMLRRDLPVYSDLSICLVLVLTNKFEIIVVKSDVHEIEFYEIKKLSVAEIKDRKVLFINYNGKVSQNAYSDILASEIAEITNRRVIFDEIFYSKFMEDSFDFIATHEVVLG
jgi:hypothetical protein